HLRLDLADYGADGRCAGDSRPLPMAVDFGRLASGSSVGRSVRPGSCLGHVGCNALDLPLAARPIIGRRDPRSCCLASNSGHGVADSIYRPERNSSRHPKLARLAEVPAAANRTALAITTGRSNSVTWPSRKPIPTT